MSRQSCASVESADSEDSQLLSEGQSLDHSSQDARSSDRFVNLEHSGSVTG
jgi:hypothetical protein